MVFAKSKAPNDTNIEGGNKKVGVEKMTKTEEVELDLPLPQVMYAGMAEVCAPSSSSSNVRLSLIEMGFLPYLVDKAIQEKGEGDIDPLLETLTSESFNQQLNAAPSRSNKNKGPGEYGATSYPQKDVHLSRSSSSDSLDSLFGDKRDENGSLPKSLDPKEEPILIDEDGDVKRAALLNMNFSVKEVDSAIDKLGKDAEIYELVDFMVATQMAESEDADRPNNEVNNPETLFGTMDRSLRLLELGFTEEDVSSAIDRFGEDTPLEDLADWICAGKPAGPFAVKAEDMAKLHDIKIKLEETDPNHGKQPEGLKDLLAEIYEGTIPKEEYDESSSYMLDLDLDDIKGKRPVGSSKNPASKRAKNLDHILHSSEKLKLGPRVGEPSSASRISNSSLDKLIGYPPYFLYGNVVSLSDESWGKMSQHMYGIQPEFVTSEVFSALSRKEGYFHNIPYEGRFHVEPKSPLTIEEVIPQTKQWWPSWDTRKKLSCISSETAGLSHICDNLGKILTDSRGVLPSELQRKVLHYGRTLNLVWVGTNKLAPIDPKHLERILGYPADHTKRPEISLSNRLELLRNCYQTDTLAYHLSGLKVLFPDGITVLSIYSGIGGAEVALHRLGIKLKGVVSIESSETKRKVLRRWWESSGQTGELVQLDDVQKLSTTKLNYLISKFEGFNLVIGRNPSVSKVKAPSKGAAAAKGAPPQGSVDDISGVDFTLYCEYVRLVQRVKSAMSFQNR